MRETIVGATLDMAKPRIVTMVLVTTSIGFFLGGYGIHHWPAFLAALAGVGLSAAGAAVLNNCLERESDMRMARTRNRALPSGLIDPAVALALGVTLVLWGVTLLVCTVNLLAGFLTLLTAFLYVLVYTPLKKVTWLNTPIGAIPGALPPMIGWAAATGQLDAGAWILFAILFTWQHPHFYAISWMFREDYALAGFKMLSVVDPTGLRLVRQSVVFSLLLIASSILLSVLRVTGALYFWGALALGIGMLASSILFALGRKGRDARRLLMASVIYLPVLLLLTLADAAFPSIGN
jgi:protoheme IX farnesyltransferase